MIYKLTFENGRIDWCTAKDQLHLLKSYDLKSYDAEFDLPIQEIESIEEISEDQAKTINVNNTDYDEDDPEVAAIISLYDLAVSDDFRIIASTEFE